MQGEYSKVVLNYKKVKSLVSSGVHSSIKNIVGQVESIIQELRSQLLRSLDKSGQTLKAQEETIRHVLLMFSMHRASYSASCRLLVELGSPTDPAWHCIKQRHANIMSLLQRAVIPSILTQPREFVFIYSCTLWIIIHICILDYSLSSASSIQANNIKQLSSILQEHLPDLWMLAKSFFAGEYHKSLSEKRRKELTEKHARAFLSISTQS